MLLLKTGKIRGAEIAMGPKAETGFGLCRYKIHLKAVAGNAQRRNRKTTVFVISCLFADSMLKTDMLGRLIFLPIRIHLSRHCSIKQSLQVFFN